MYPLQAYSVPLIMHQAGILIHIQASPPLTLMSSMHFLGSELLHLCKIFFCAVFLFNITYGGNWGQRLVNGSGGLH
jgi:hypothetical protein